MGLGNFFVRDKAATQASAVKKPSDAAPVAPVVIRDKNDGDDLIDALLHGKEIVTEIETDFGVFEFRYPSGTDYVRIAHRRADYLGGYPDSAFDNVRRSQFEKWATLDILIGKKPERFAEIVSWADCPMQELVEVLYERGARFCGDIRKKIAGNDAGRAGTESKPSDS